MIRVIFALLAGFAILIGTYVYLAQPESIMVENSFVNEEFLDSVNDTDTDMDGLKDWEEVLWGSSSSEYDTDGDGTNDGDEVLQGRNPTIAGPDDLITAETEPGQQKLGVSGTDSIAEKFITEYFLLRERKGGSLTEDDEKALVEHLLSDITLPVEHVPYTEVDFNSVSNNTAQYIRIYGNDVGRSIVENSPEDLENELVIFTRAFEENNEDELEKLDPILTGYAEVQKVLVSMDVPETALEIHMDLTNTIVSLRASIRAMRNAFVDPVGSVAGVEQYRRDAENFSNVLQELSNFFLKNNVTFGENEHGSILVQTI